MRELRHTLSLVAIGATSGALFAAACSGADDSGTASNFNNVGGAGGTSAAGGTSGSGAIGVGGNGAGISFDGSANDGALTADSACVEQSAEATLVKKPVDIIFVIDNSCSMSNENKAVENNINQNFANIISASGIDYRVIMITAHASGYKVAVSPPLAGPGGTASKPANNPPIFYHYDTTVSSHNALCVLFDTYQTPDKHAFGQGWKDWARPEALKYFVPITDDGTSCTSSKSGQNYSDGNSVAAGQTAADKWEADLFALDPLQFGTAANPNYVFYSILGMPANNPASAPWLATDPVITGKCSTGVDPGTAYQWLSNKTGGLKFPVCEGNGFDVVFQKLAEGVIKGAKVACEFPVPTPPPGQEIDPATVKVVYTPGAGGNGATFSKVDNAAACQPNAFYIENDTVKLCPTACALVQGDDAAKLQVLFACKKGGPA